MASRTESGEPDGGGRSTTHQMTKEEWLAEQERNLKCLECRILCPPDNYQTITKSY